MDAPQRTQKDQKRSNKSSTVPYTPIIIAESRIIAVITLYRYIFDFLESQKFEKRLLFRG